jgi:hypothetical protein
LRELAGSVEVIGEWWAWRSGPWSWRVRQAVGVGSTNAEHGYRLPDQQPMADAVNARPPRLTATAPDEAQAGMRFRHAPTSASPGPAPCAR